MPNRLVIDMTEFRQQLRNLPRELAGEASGIVTGAAEGAKDEVVNAYPDGTGNLRRGVKVTKETSVFGTSAVVRSNARHSHLYEYGSQVRHNANGANRGAMPTRPTFIPIVMRRRKAMYDALKNLLVRAGFQVSGDV